MESADRWTNRFLAGAAGTLVRTFDAISIRGAPTILRVLWNVPALRSITATRPLFGDEWIKFPAFDAYWCRYLWSRVPYERDVEQIFRKIGKGRVLVDCGANIGYWSVRAKEFGFTDVIAVEASAERVGFLAENFRLNRLKGLVHHAAIHSVSGEELLLDPAGSHAQAHIGTRGTPILSISLADIAADISPDQEIVAKLDVEGSEVPAMEGARDLQNFIFVYEDFPRRGMGGTKYVLSRGMVVFGVGPNGTYARLHTLDEVLAFHYAANPGESHANLIACLPERAAKLESELGDAFVWPPVKKQKRAYDVSSTATGEVSTASE